MHAQKLEWHAPFPFFTICISAAFIIFFGVYRRALISFAGERKCENVV